jgi:ATP-dependent Clp protease protease subunit
MTRTEQQVPEWPPPTPSPWRPAPPAPQEPRRIVPFVTPPPSDDDVPAALLRRRVVLLAGPLTWAAANEAAAKLMLLDAAGSEPVRLHVSCPDAELAPALMLADTVDLVRGRVDAVAQGIVASAALAPFAASDRRLALPHAVFQFREPTMPPASGSAEQVAAAADGHRQATDQLRGWLVRATGHSADRIDEDLRSGRFLTAAEAVRYGLVAEVLTPGT